MGIERKLLLSLVSVSLVITPVLSLNMNVLASEIDGVKDKVVVSKFPEVLNGGSTYDSDEEAYWRQFSTDYYYNQLSSDEKELYDRLDDSAMDLLLGDAQVDSKYTVEINDLNLSKADVSNVQHIFKVSNPQYFFLDSLFSVSFYSGDDHPYNANMYLYSAFCSGSDRASARDYLKSVFDEYLDELDDYTYPEQKEIALVVLMCENISYYSGASYNQSVYSAANGATVCTGYSLMFTAIMNACGVECATVCSNNHAWNFINIHGFWYYCDVTWADQDSGNWIYYGYYNHEVPSDTALSYFSQYLPEFYYDMLNSSSTYTSRYTEVDGVIYCIVSDTSSAGRKVVSVSGSSTASTVVIYGYTYDVINNSTVDLISMSLVTVASIDDQTYTGSSICPPVKLTYDSSELVEGLDYNVEYSNNVNAGTATVTVTGIGNYSGSSTATFTIAPKSLSGVTVASIENMTYTGSALTPDVTVKDGSKTLVSDTDYTLTYSNNIDVGTANVTITGKGNYTGTKTATFVIEYGDTEYSITWGQDIRTIPGVVFVNSCSSTGSINKAKAGSICYIEMQLFTGSTLNSVTVNGQKITDYQIVDEADLHEWQARRNKGDAIKVQFTMPAEDVVYYIDVTAAKYSITVNESEHGIAVSDKDFAYPYVDKIVLDVSPEDGYVLESLIVSGVEPGGHVINEDYIGDYGFAADATEYTLSMPFADVTITVKFKKIENTDYPTTGWVKIDGLWHLYDDNGNLLTGWQKDNGKWYYLDPDSAGAMKTGWLKSGGKWYFLDNSGAMVTGWVKDGGIWYYLKPGSGEMMTGWQSIDGSWYCFENNGKMMTGWKASGSTWYYLSDSGAMVTGWQKISGKWYYFESSGAMVSDWQKINGKWYYFESSGSMHTGWLLDGSTWYYLDPDSGAMVYDSEREINGKTYSFDESGACENP